MAVLVKDKTLARVAIKQDATKEVDKQSELVDALIKGQNKTDELLLFLGKQIINIKEQNKTDEILLFIGQQIINLKEQKKPVDVIANVIRDGDNKITQIHIKENK